MKFTVPNLITLSRLGLVPLFIIAVTDGRPAVALAIMALAGLSDALDGALARLWRQQSVLGAYLDPIADKMLLISAWAVLAIPSLNPGPTIPLWVVILIIARDIAIVVVALVLYLSIGMKDFPPTKISKVTTVVQIIAVLLVLIAALEPAVETAAQIAIYSAAALTVASGLRYLQLTNRKAAERLDASGGPPPP